MNIELINPYNKKRLSITESGLSDDENNRFELVEGAYRIVPKENYASSFGYQWNKFRKTQIDKFNGRNLTRDRFFAATGWDKMDLSGQNILEAGCGAGRFTQIVLDYTAGNLFSFDFSDSVTANYDNNGPHERLNLFQASIYEMPFPPNTFDKVFCFGVLQFTPDFRKSIASLVDVLKPGGELVVDYFPINGWWTKVSAKFFLKPLTRRMDNKVLMERIAKNVNWMISMYKFFDRLGIGRIVNRFIPICDIKNTLPNDLNKEELREWVILDTYNMLSPAFENPQSQKRITEWLVELGMKNIDARIRHYGDSNSVHVIRSIKPK